MSGFKLKTHKFVQKHFFHPAVPLTTPAMTMDEYFSGQNPNSTSRYQELNRVSSELHNFMSMVGSKHHIDMKAIQDYGR